MFHEFPELSVQLAPSDWSIVRRFIAVAMDQVGSGDMASEMKRRPGSDELSGLPAPLDLVMAIGTTSAPGRERNL